MERGNAEPVATGRRRQGPRPLNFHELTLGILVVLMLIATVAATAFFVKKRFAADDDSATGPGVFAAAGLNLTPDSCVIAAEEIQLGLPGRDAIPSLTNPPVTSSVAAGWLRPDDRVIGLSIAGQARAYPIRILDWHEAVNDSIGGEDVLVTWCPLCASALVFDRNIGGRPREFGISGLLLNSNVLLYDRGAEESLWSQLLMTAVCGPAAEEGLQLKLLPSTVCSWESWEEAHPETSVLSRETGFGRDYESNPYSEYLATQRLMFPVRWSPAPGSEQLLPKDEVLLVSLESQILGYSLKWLDRAAGEGELFVDWPGGSKLRFQRIPSSPGDFSVTTGDGAPVPSGRMFHFAFRANHPTAPLHVGSALSSCATGGIAP